MRRVLPSVVMIFTFLLCVSLIATAGQGQDKAKAKKKTVVEGTWIGTEDDADNILTFAGDKFTLARKKDKSQALTGTFKLDETKTPIAIDMTVTGGTSKQAEKYMGKTSLGIVKVDGNKLAWRHNEPGKEGRPKTFTDKEGDAKYVLFTFERAKK